jgi:hypothetical protein
MWYSAILETMGLESINTGMLPRLFAEYFAAYVPCLGRSEQKTFCYK